MMVDSCAQQPTYERFFGLLGQYICLIENDYADCFQNVFRDQYATGNNLDNAKLRNLAKFFAHLLATDTISWGVCIHYQYQIKILCFYFPSRYLNIFI